MASHVFPLFEVEDGRRWRLTIEPEPATIEEYIEGQGRFRHLAGDAAALEQVRQGVEERWRQLLARTQSPCTPS